MSLKRFKEDFDRDFPNDIYLFMEKCDSGNIPFNGILVEDNDQVNHDSYGNEDSKLERVFHFPNYGIYVMFSGTRCSYQGEEWDAFKQVVPKEEKITKFNVVEEAKTVKYIIEKIEEAEISVDEFAYGDFETPEGVGEWEEVDQVGGEGQGDHWHSVKHFKDSNVYIKTIGHYSSYDGVDFYDGYGEEVTPQQKTITVYQ